MSLEELLKKIADPKTSADDREQMKAEAAERYGVYVIAENLGICECCGKVKDLRSGLCYECAKEKGFL